MKSGLLDVDPSQMTDKNTQPSLDNMQYNRKIFTFNIQK